MIRIAIGLTLIILMVLLKSIFNHNIDYWGPIKSLTVLLGIIGFIILGFNIINKIGSFKPRSFTLYPLQGLLFLVSYLMFFSVIIAAVIQLELVGAWANTKLRDYYLSHNTTETQGTVMGDVDISYQIKYRKHLERFTLIQYNTIHGTIRQGVDPSLGLTAGDSVKVVYSKTHPTFSEIKKLVNPHYP